MKIVSMKQLRQNFETVKKGLSRGESYLLMYRSKPLGVMRPYAPETDAKYLGTGEVIPSLPPARMAKALPTPGRPSLMPPSNGNNPLNRLKMRRAFL